VKMSADRLNRKIALRTLKCAAVFLTVMASLTPAFAQEAPAEDDASKPRSSSSPTFTKQPPSLKQPQAPDAPEKADTDAPIFDQTRQKMIPLYIGIEHDEQLPYLPANPRFKGDFKKVAKLAVNYQTKTLKFQAVQEGVATLTIHDANGRMIYDFRIDVKRSNLTKVANEIKSLLNEIEGITIKIVNNRVVVDGQVLLPRDMSRIISVVSQYGDQLASSLVTLSPVAQKRIANQISNQIGSPEISVRAVSDKFILEGVAQSQEEKDRADAIAQIYVPDIVKEEGEINGKIVKLRKTFVLNLITVKAAPPKDPGKIIQLVVHYVELNKDYEKSFKFQFMPSLQDNSQLSFTQDSRQPGGMISTITGTVSNLLPKLNWAKAHGHARVLQSSSLIILDGQKGDVKNQTRVPYQTSNAQGQPITQFEDTGFLTTITPTILNARSDSIRLQMDFSMKSLVGLTDKGPMVSNSAITTVIVVRSGQSAAVGGLISNSTSTDFNKMPKSNGADPIISLYASKSFQRNQSQFVVFVTPIIKSSASQGAEKMKQKFRLRE
jgi:pilus assembly protein CpaC